MTMVIFREGLKVMKNKRVRVFGSLLSGMMMLAAYGASAEAAVVAEKEYTEKLPPTMGDHWVLAATNQSYTLYDGDKAKLLGTLPANFEANVAVSPDRHTYYVATTMWTRFDHGDREDFLQAYDASTLTLTKEIPLPPRALAVFKNRNLGLSSDGKWAYVFDMTPTTRVTVVDLKAAKVATTIDIPGCAMEFQWAHGGFSAICGDGGLANVAFDGKKASVTHTKPFFNADEAPIFEQSPIDPVHGVAYFITYDGKVYQTTLGPNAKPDAPWGLAAAAGKPEAGRGVQELAWRPGGMEPFAVNAKQHRLYVLMHVGNYWSHKQAGAEIWVFDTQTKKLVTRLTPPKPVIAISVSQDEKPQLYAVTAENRAPADLLVMDPATGKVEHSIVAKASPMTVVAGMQ